MSDDQPKRPASKRPKTYPGCPIPDGERHNSVRAAREGCICSGALIAYERERDRDRTKSKARRQRDAELCAQRRFEEAQAAAAEEARRERRRRRRSAVERVPAPVQEPGVDTRLPPGLHLRPATEHERALRARDDLACHHEDPDLFFPVGEGRMTHSQEVAAKQVCGRCPALDLCRTVALQVLPSHGVVGGFSPADRRQLRAKGWAA